MPAPSAQIPSPPSGRVTLPAGVRWPDISFRWLALLAAVTIGLLIALVGWELYQGSRMAIGQFGPKFLVS